MGLENRWPVRVKCYSFGAHQEPLNVRSLREATEIAASPRNVAKGHINRVGWPMSAACRLHPRSALLLPSERRLSVVHCSRRPIAVKRVCLDGRLQAHHI